MERYYFISSEALDSVFYVINIFSHTLHLLQSYQTVLYQIVNVPIFTDQRQAGADATHEIFKVPFLSERSYQLCTLL